MALAQGDRTASSRFKAWFPPIFFALVAAGTLPVVFTHLFVPSAAVAPSAAAIFGREYADEQLPAFDRRPWLIHAHAVIGLVLVVVGPLQFWRGFRNRHRRFHRLAGYTLAAVLALLAVTGFAVALAYPFAGLAGAAPNFVWMAAILACLGLAIFNARRRNILEHEAWMTRAMAITLGVTFASLYIPLLTGVMRLPSRTALAVSFWLGVGECLAVAEAWLRRPGRPRAARRRSP